MIDTTDTNPDEAIPVGDEFPLADIDDDDAVVSAGCAEGESICDDPPVLPTEGTDLPSVADGEPIEGPPSIDPQPEPDPAQSVSSGMPANGGITVSAALATEATGILAVQGHLYDDGSPGAGFEPARPEGQGGLSVAESVQPAPPSRNMS